MRTVLFAALCILVITQINHLKSDFGFLNNPSKATLTATAFIIAVNVCYSASFDYVRNGQMTPKMTTTMTVVFLLTMFGSWISVNASIRAFAQDKHQLVMNQQAGPAAMAYRNKMVRADNRLNELAEAGVTSGAEYDRLTQEVSAGAQQYKGEVGEEGQESAYAKAIAGGDTDSKIDKKVHRTSIWQALGLEGLCAAISILLGLGKPVHQKIEDTFGAPPKKSRGTGAAR